MIWSICETFLKSSLSLHATIASFFLKKKKYKSFPYYIDFEEFATVTKLCIKKKKKLQWDTSMDVKVT